MSEVKEAVKIRGFEVVAENHLKSHEKQEQVALPLRGTAKSAGYDVFLPETIEVMPNDGVLVWTDIKAYMQEGEVLEIYPRSSTGVKRNIRIKNTVGIIDCDYYSNPKNDGNIGVFLWNFGQKVQVFEKGEAVAQVIFKPFLVADNCNTDVIREGGIGSTDKKEEA